MDTHLWTWSGRDFGDRDGNELWTHDGRHVGRYLGELRHDDRLITDTTKRARRRPAFRPLLDRRPRTTFIGFGGFVMPADCEGFPRPEALR